MYSVRLILWMGCTIYYFRLLLIMWSNKVNLHVFWQFLSAQCDWLHLTIIFWTWLFRIIMTGESDFLVVKVVLFGTSYFHSDNSLHLVLVFSTAILYWSLYSAIPCVIVQILGILRLSSFKHNIIFWFEESLLSTHYINWYCSRNCLSLRKWRTLVNKVE
jgi:hypothetical protein